MKTTKKDFEYFVARCEYWKNSLHLGHWKIKYEHKDLANTCYAQNQIYPSTFNAIIRLNTNWSNNESKLVSKAELDTDALHEVLHILYSYPEEEVVVRLTRLLGGGL